MDCSLSGFLVHGSLQARTLECVAIPFSHQIYVLERAKKSEDEYNFHSLFIGVT